MKMVNHIKTRIRVSKEKIIAVFLSMMMAVSFLPTAYAFAETPEPETSAEIPVTTEILLTLSETTQDASAPVPDAPPISTAPGNSLVANEDGTYIELDGNGVSLFQWTWDTEVGEWKSEPVAQWSWTEETVEWVFDESDVPLSEWTFTDTVDWEFGEADVPLADLPIDEIPKTDDNTDIFLRAALFGTSALGLAVLILMSKKSAKAR